MNKTSMQILRTRSARIVKVAVVAAVVSIAAPVAYGTATAQQPASASGDIRWAMSIKEFTVCALKCWRYAKYCCEIFENPR